MSKIKTALTLLQKERGKFVAEIIKDFFYWLPDKLYLSMLYLFRFDNRINWKNPKNFNEKLQWLKLYNRKPEYSALVDKYEVKDYVSKIIGCQYVIPTIAIWDRIEDIDWEILPNKFVLKTTNGGGGVGVVICKDKTKLDTKKATANLKKSLKSNIYKTYKEWPYKNVKPRIIAENLIETQPDEELHDYKFYCFNGVPKVMLISHGRFSGGKSFDYFDMDFNLLPFQQGAPNSGLSYNEPANFNLMKTLAAKVSKGLPHARIDLYNNNGTIYFGEITFFDSSGFAEFKPKEWDRIFGDWLTLPEKQK